MQHTQMSQEPIAEPTFFNTSNMIAFTARLVQKQVADSFEVFRRNLLSEFAEDVEALEAEIVTTDGSQKTQLRAQVRKLQNYLTEVRAAVILINVVTTAAGEPFGHAYVWTSSPVLYNLLTGFNSDGSVRMKKVPAPVWDGKPDDFPEGGSEEDLLAYIESMIDAETKGMDPESPEYQMIALRVKEAYTPPMIEIVDPDRDLVLPVCTYTPEQQAAVMADIRDLSTPRRSLYAKTPVELEEVAKLLRANPRTAKYAENPRDWIEHEIERIESSREKILMDKYKPMPRVWDPRWVEGETVFLPAGFEVPKHAPINVERAYVKEPDPSVDKQTLCCRDVPSWVTAEMLHAIFSKFSTDSRVRKVMEDRAERTITFPHVRLNPDGTGRRAERPDLWGGTYKMANIAFSNAGDSQWDASFALQMCRRVTLPVPDHVTTGPRTANLIFSLWIKNTYASGYGGRGGGRDDRSDSGRAGPPREGGGLTGPPREGGGRGGYPPRDGGGRGGRGWAPREGGGGGRGWAPREDGGRGGGGRGWAPRDSGPREDARPRLPIPSVSTGLPPPRTATDTPQLVSGPFTDGRFVEKSGPPVSVWGQRSRDKPSSTTPEATLPMPSSSAPRGGLPPPRTFRPS